MKKYRVVASITIESLESRVTVWMSRGWIPQGGIALQIDRHGFADRFFQAMIREDDDKTKDLQT